MQLIRLLKLSVGKTLQRNTAELIHHVLFTSRSQLGSCQLMMTVKSDFKISVENVPFGPQCQYCL